MTALRIRGRGRPKIHSSKPVEPLESAIQTNIRSALEQVGCHVSSTSQYRQSRQTVGMFDLFIVQPAWRVFCWADTKRPGEELSRDQLAWMQPVVEAGVPCLVFTSPEDAVQQVANLPRQRACVEIT